MSAEPGSAEDLAHDAILVALEEGHDEPTPSRSWLAGIVRRLFLRRRRRFPDGADVDVEALEIAPSSLDELIAKHLREEVSRAIETLREPYRTTAALWILSRLSPRAIAEELGVPLRTVYTRLDRCRPVLRHRLRGYWELALTLLLVLRPGWGTPRVRGGFAWAAVGIAVLSLTWISLEGTAVVAEPTRPTAVVGSEPESLEGRVPLPSGRKVVASRVATEEEDDLVRVRAIDTTGKPIADISVRWEPSDPRGHRWGGYRDDGGRRFVTDERGELGFPRPDETGRLVVDDERFAAVAHPLLGSPSDESDTDVVHLVVAERVRVSGTVRDDSGEPLEDAVVHVSIADSRWEEIRPSSSRYEASTHEMQTGPDGTFLLDGVAWDRGVTLTISKAGWISEQRPMARPEAGPVHVVLSRPAERGSDVRGRVVGVLGDPIPGAWVSGGGWAVPTESDGSFVLASAEILAERVVTAVAPGFAPSAVSADEADGSLLLVLDTATSSLRGRVLDERGRPVASATLYVPDAEPFGVVTAPHRGLRLARHTTVEDMSRAGHSTARTDGPFLRTDADGGFVLAGLGHRPYTLCIVHPETLELTEVQAVRPGTTPLTVRFRGVGPDDRVAGRVVAPDGTPLSGIQLTVGRSLRTVVATDRRDSLFGLRVGVTDAHGRFRFEGIATDHALLFVSGEAILDGFHHLDEVRGERDIVVPRRCSVRLSVDPAAAVTAVRFLDAEGTELHSLSGSSRETETNIHVHPSDGEPELLFVDERVARVAVTLESGESYEIPFRADPARLVELGL